MVNGEHTASGAAEAAADLARARRGLNAAERDDDALRAARDVFRDIAVLLDHGGSHARASDLFDRLQMSFGACLVHHARLEIALEPRAVLLGAEVLFETDTTETNPWYPLFGDGIRRLEIRRGLSRREIEDLIGILRTRLDRRGGDTDDDAVTLLWQRDLEHVRFHAADRFGAGGDEALDALVADYRDRAPAEHGRDRSPTGPALECLRADNLALVSEIPGDARAVSFRLLRVDDEDIARLTTLCEEDRTYAGRYFGALLSALAQRGDTDDGPVVLESLRELCLRLIGTGELRKAHQMLVYLGRAVPSATGIADFLIPDPAIARIAATMAAHPDGPVEDEAVALLGALSPGRSRALLAAARNLDDRRQRARLYEIAAQWGASAASAAGEILRDSMGEISVELLGLLRTIGGEAAQLALEQASFDTSTATRADALRAYFKLAPRAAALKRAERGLRSGDARTRRISLEYFVSRREPRAANLIKGRIRDPAFPTADVEEQRRTYRAYAALGGNRAGEWLVEQLGQRNTAGRDKIERERALAAYALGHLRYQPARPLLEQLANGRMTRSRLKQACADALAIIDQPPGDAPGPTADSVTAPPVAPAGKQPPARERQPRRPTDLPTYRGAAVDASALSTVSSYLMTRERGKRADTGDDRPARRVDVDALLSEYVGDSDE